MSANGYRRKQRVRVVKPFQETRTPCPVAGTEGKVVEIESEYITVAFWSFTDAEGAQWGPGRGDGSEPFELKFKPDEIEPVAKVGRRHA